MTITSTATLAPSIKASSLDSQVASPNRLSPMQLKLSPPKEDEYQALAIILRDSFDISGKAIWLDSSPEDLLQFRISVIQHRDSLRKLAEDGQISTQHRMLVARDTSSDQVIGFAIWSLDDDLSDADRAKSEEEETRLAIPMGDPPTGTRKELWNEVFEAFVKVRSTHMKGLSNCYVKYLCIDNKVQRSGAGTALMKAIRKDAGNRPLYLEAADTPSAIQFYKKLGFTILERLEIDELRYTVMILEANTDSILDYDAVSTVSR